MNKYVLLIYLIIGVFSCSDDDIDTVPSYYDGFASLKINGKTMEFLPRMASSKRIDTEDKFKLNLDYKDEFGIVRKRMSMSLVEATTDIQVLRQYSERNFDTLKLLIGTFATLISDGDVLGNYYDINEADDISNYLKLTDLNLETGAIKGEFQASFVLDSFVRFDPSSPDTIVITDGYFETTLFE